MWILFCLTEKDICLPMSIERKCFLWYNKRKQWHRSDKSFHKMTRNTPYKRAKIKAQEVESDELVRKH